MWKRVDAGRGQRNYKPYIRPKTRGQIFWINENYQSVNDPTVSSGNTESKE